MTRLARVAASAVERAVLTARGVMEVAGLSYDALHSWRSERREPSPESLERLADAFEQHARELDRLAAVLRKEAAK